MQGLRDVRRSILKQDPPFFHHLPTLNRLKKVQGKKKEAAARDTLERESRQAAEGTHVDIYLFIHFWWTKREYSIMFSW